jgi:hypothetical protein
MGEKLWVTPPAPGGMRVRHVGVLDLGEFYKWLVRWLTFRGFWSNTNETQYLERVTPTGKKYELIWECKKEQSSHFTYCVRLTLLLIGINDVEVQRDNKKFKIQKGDFEIRIAAHVEKTYETKGLINRFYEILIRRRIEEYKLDLYEKVYELQEYIKEYFGQYVM